LFLPLPVLVVAYSCRCLSLPLQLSLLLFVIAVTLSEAKDPDTAKPTYTAHALSANTPAPSLCLFSKHPKPQQNRVSSPKTT
jgi:hypothetical protein